MLTCRIHFFWYSFLQIFVSFVCCLCVVDLAATPMSSYYPIVYKQQVVTYYTQHLPHTSFRAVARLFNIKGWSYDSRRVGMTDVTHCCTKQKSGRPTILSSQQINTHITKKIIQYNRTPTPIHYTKLLSHVKHATQKTFINTNMTSLRKTTRWYKNETNHQTCRGRM